jgi:hypothetical protein
MPSHAIVRLLESFFRHPLLHLLPLVAFATLGGWHVSSQQETYRSGGVLLVADQTLLSSLTGLRGGESGWETPAQFTSGQLNTLLQSDTFVIGVAERAGVGDATTLTGDDVQELRDSLGSWGTGRDLVHVWAEHEDPRTAQRLADATIQRLIHWRVDNEVSDSVAAEAFLAPIRERYAEELAAARAALADYLRDTAPREGDRSAVEQAMIKDLTVALTDAEMRYAGALADEETARLAAATAESDVQSQLQVLDAPTLPTAPETSLRTLAVAFAAFIVVGLILSLASIAVGMLSDRTVRFREDVDRLGVELLAQIPNLANRSRRHLNSLP